MSAWSKSHVYHMYLLSWTLSWLHMRRHIAGLFSKSLLPCKEPFSRDSDKKSLISVFNIFISSRKYKCTANEVRTTRYYSCADVIKKLSPSFQRIFNSKGIPFYRSVVIRTEIITTAACTIMRRLGPPTANYETPNSGSKLWSVRYGRSWHQDRVYFGAPKYHNSRNPPTK